MMSCVVVLLQHGHSKGMATGHPIIIICINAWAMQCTQPGMLVNAVM